MGPFTIIHELCAGRLSRVYLARDNNGAQVVLKRAAADDVAREAEILEALDHCNIIRVLGTEEDPPAVVLEYLEGQTLDAATRGPLPEALVTAIGVQLALALTEVHARGFIHRDVNPSNVFLQPDGRVVLTDFGIATRSGTRSDRQGEQVSGTPLYLSPEQLQKDAKLTTASDVYSLGVTLYFAMSECLPYHATDFAGLAKAIENDPPLPLGRLVDVSPWLEKLIAQMLEKSPRMRPTADKVAKLLGSTEEPRRVTRQLLARRSSST